MMFQRYFVLCLLLSFLLCIGCSDEVLTANPIDEVGHTDENEQEMMDSDDEVNPDPEGGMPDDNSSGSGDDQQDPDTPEDVSPSPTKEELVAKCIPLDQRLWNNEVYPWPAETLDLSLKLFTVDPPLTLNENNWSGAYWNADLKLLWLARNNFGLRQYRWINEGFTLEKNINFEVDFEGITQANNNEDVIYTVAETEMELQSYLVVDNNILIQENWDLTGLDPGEGFEGLTFVPDKALTKQKFKTDQGIDYPKSAFGRGGLFFLSHQANNQLYVLDLNMNGEFVLVGSYQIPIASPRGLEFDRDSHLIYIIDGANLARVWLTPQQGNFAELQVLDVYDGTGLAGSESIALPPMLEEKQWLIVTDDDNTAGNTAILKYQQFKPCKRSVQ